MEWTPDLLKKLAADNGLTALNGSAHFGEQINVLHGTTFNLCVELPGFGRRELTDYNGKLSLKLESYVTFQETPATDDFEGWSAALGALLNSPKYTKLAEFGSTSKALERVFTLLQSRLEGHRVKYQPYRLRVAGVGKVELACWPDGLERTLDVYNKSGEVVGRVKVHFLRDDLTEKVGEVLQLLGVVTETAAEPTTLSEFLARFDEVPKLENFTYSHDPGDSRSYGQLSVEFDLPGGHVEVDTLLVGSGGGLELGGDETLKLNGVELEPTFDDLEVDVPHSYGGGKAMERWEATASETLLADFSAWVLSLWEETHV